MLTWALCVHRVPDECPAELDTIIQDSVAEDPDDRPDMRTLYERLKKAAMIPPPGLTRCVLDLTSFLCQIFNVWVACMCGLAV